MKRYLLTALACAASALGVSSVAVAAAQTSSAGHPAPLAASVAKTCSSGYVHGVILGSQKCLRRGEYCTHTRAAERDYRRYHFSCANRDRRGSYHLISA
jgi:hypothetical protein